MNVRQLKYLGFVSLAATLAASFVGKAVAQTPASETASPRLLLAFASYRERPKYPTILFFEVDGVTGSCKAAGSIAVSGLRSDTRPSLSRDGRYCAFASEEENQTSRVFLWDRGEQKLLEHPLVNESPNALLHPTLSGDGRLLIFGGWNRPSASQRWDLFRYDIEARSLSALGDVNTLEHDERMPALSADGELLAYVTNEPGGVGLTDIGLCQLLDGSHLSLPGLNSENSDVDPTLSGDGRFLAFISDRPGGSGGRDLYLYDRQSQSLVPLPGLNSVAHEQSPSLSADGRFIAFVSERIRGAGERDVFLYDRQTQRSLDISALNSPREELDPCIIVMP